MYEFRINFTPYLMSRCAQFKPNGSLVFEYKIVHLVPLQPRTQGSLGTTATSLCERIISLEF